MTTEKKVMTRYPALIDVEKEANGVSLPVLSSIVAGHKHG